MRIKLTCVFVDDQRAEYDRLIAAGVTFTQRPTDVGTVLMPVFDDKSVNLIQIISQK